jgi:hypothetical protein
VDRYDVFLGTSVAGNATVEKQGLYYLVRGLCVLEPGAMFRLVASCGGRQADLGILVPGDGGFQLSTRIPVKRLGEGQMRFCLLPRHESVKGMFIPLAPEEPFSYISKLRNAYLEQRNGTPGVVIQENGGGIPSA